MKRRRLLFIIGGALLSFVLLADTLLFPSPRRPSQPNSSHDSTLKLKSENQNDVYANAMRQRIEEVRQDHVREGSKEDAAGLVRDDGLDRSSKKSAKEQRVSTPFLQMSAPQRFGGPRSDGIKQSMSDAPMPLSKIIQGAQIGDSTIDSTLPPDFLAKSPSNEMSEEELLRQWQDINLVYTWVNGSATNQMFRKFKIFARNNERKLSFVKIRRDGDRSNGPTIEEFLSAHRSNIVNGRDRESGELMYSIRSLEKFMKWHIGRIIIVSPGHVPFWLDDISAFFGHGSRGVAASSPFSRWINQQQHDGNSEDEESQRRFPRRLTIVHQDAIVPWNHRETFNTNTIEPNIWKLPNLGNLFIQFNDDYMVGSETKITDFINRKGGPVLLYETGYLRGGLLSYQKLKAAKSPKTWIAGVYHTNSLVTKLLDSTIQNSVFDALGRVLDREARPSPHPKRLYIKHAPFVYCKHMQKYVYHALGQEIEQAGVLNKFRNYSDVVEPFLHHTLVMEAPWRGSSLYIEGKKQSERTKHLFLDGNSACAPAVGKIGTSTSSRLLVMTDNMQENLKRLGEIRREKPQFFTLNDGYTQAKVSTTIRRFLQEWFPLPSSFDYRHHHHVWSEELDNLFGRTHSTDGEWKAAKRTAFVFHVSSVDHICASLRSLELALRSFDGLIYFFIHSDEATLEELVKDSLTMDTWDGTRSGFEDTNRISDWIALCHVDPTTVKLHFVGNNFALEDINQVFSEWYTLAKTDGNMDRERVVSGDQIAFFVCPKMNAVLGQTLALEDFELIQDLKVAPKAAVASLRAMDVAFVEGPNAVDVLKTFPLPYRRYERVLWD